MPIIEEVGDLLEGAKKDTNQFRIGQQIQSITSIVASLGIVILVIKAFAPSAPKAKKR